MRIATWNVNSVRTRAERIVAFLDRQQVDVLAMQETKAADAKFPYDVFHDAGYEVAHVGYNQWNGVAIASRVGLSDVRDHFERQPSFAKKGEPVREARAVGANCGGVEVWSLYVPNGREIGDPHYDYKLQFLYSLQDTVRPGELQVLTGDFNIAPRDENVWDIDWFDGKTHVTEPERAAFQMLCETGLTQLEHEELYSFWDYKSARFQRNEGMLIDFQLATAPLAALATRVWVDVDERRGTGASDHAPVIAEYDTRGLDYDQVR
ncbi:exodeoxyribonuclease III [Corynebacterium imitans]|uniref:exodeoxyribonuclease III n=1 Tax=Corynebacterium imitans TaxID=156978 RepID=UPI00254B2C8B|nr:exodeoxyribonuclease III [Corynebacterium imitans]MDK8307333.1 exodeoxyribonuclease III [Corynebacterium imitans]MDK8638492.1 exodeoxyribonuclease III [Corynebacterium imitans]MDK8773710.1 exodeoxyribonuclease III [Corynebacterium imitans]